MWWCAPDLNITLDIGLQLGNVSQSVEVSAGDSPLLETFSAEQAVDISGELVRNLPLTGRREWSDTLLLTPGILSASTDAYGGQVYSCAAAKTKTTRPCWTGADISSFEQNWPSNFIRISTESSGDIQVKTGASDASSPSAMRMVINMATPTGGDQFHGVLSLLDSPQALNSNNTPGGQSALSEALQPDFSLSADQETQGVVLRVGPLHQSPRRHQPDCAAVRSASGCVPGVPGIR
jgi:hypothetical protein